MNTEKIIDFLFEIASLRRLTRSHRQFRDVSDNISDHSFRTAVIGMNLAKLEGADENKVLKMALFHDVLEARTGDANLINKQYLELKEEEARKDQMEGLPVGVEIISLLEEYEKKESKEAIVAKDADLIDQMVLQQEYFYNDDKNNVVWQGFTEKSLKTKSAQELAKKIRGSNPVEWLYRLVEHKVGKKID